MAATEDQLKRNAELKLWIETRIGELQEETDRLREALTVIDSVLRASSFKPAADMASSGPRPPLARPTEPSAEPIPEIRELKRDKGGETVAVAQVTRQRLYLEPLPGDLRDGHRLASLVPLELSDLGDGLCRRLGRPGERGARSGRGHVSGGLEAGGSQDGVYYRERLPQPVGLLLQLAYPGLNPELQLGVALELVLGCRHLRWTTCKPFLKL